MYHPRNACVVTGSSSGIGAATARPYAKEGWDVVLNFAHHEAPAQAVAAQCQPLGAEVLIVRCDVSQDADCRHLAAEVEATFGRADVLVNNAGTTKFVGLKDMDGLDADDFHRIYGVKVIGPYQRIRALLPLLQRSPGAGVVNISSIAGTLAFGSSMAYIASKGSLNALTLGLARTLGPQVRVNAIAPGFVETPRLKSGLGAERYETNRAGYIARASLKEVMAPEDIADAAWWLGACAAKTTGEVATVDAGFGITAV